MTATLYLFARGDHPLLPSVQLIFPKKNNALSDSSTVGHGSCGSFTPATRPLKSHRRSATPTRLNRTVARQNGSQLSENSAVVCCCSLPMLSSRVAGLAFSNQEL